MKTTHFKFSYEFPDITFMPQVFEEGVVYVLKNDCVAILVCPCGCGDDIYLNLVQTASPKWQIKENSITPSINKLYGCKSHFQIINGEIKI